MRFLAKKTMSLVLAFVLCTIMCVPSLATTQFDAEDSRWSYDSSGNLVYLVGDEVDTTPFEIPSGLDNTRGRRLLFRMNITAMYHDLHTTGAKSFTKSDLSNAYVRASGKINNETSTYSYATVGLCKYDGGFYALAWSLQNVNCGTAFAISWPKSSLESYYYYYGYVQSPYSSPLTPYSGYVDYFDSSVN